jgi:hypothetical protein
MSWITAGPVRATIAQVAFRCVAQVIHHQIITHRTDCQNVSEPVGDIILALQLKSTVSLVTE